MEIIHVGSLKIVSSLVLPGSKLVRFHVGDEPHYKAMTVITPEHEGKLVHLSGFMGHHLEPSEIPWIGLRDGLFPLADEAYWERLMPNGTLKNKRVRIPRL